MTQYTTLSEELNKLPRERQELIEIRELAERLEVQQPAISKLERRQNLELNTLRAVVDALGGTIEIIVRVPNKEPILLSDYQES